MIGMMACTHTHTHTHTVDSRPGLLAVQQRDTAKDLCKLLGLELRGVETKHLGTVVGAGHEKGIVHRLGLDDRVVRSWCVICGLGRLLSPRACCTVEVSWALDFVVRVGFAESG